MELPSLVCLCVLISCGVSSADANEPVKVKEGNDVVLPCSLSTKENIESKLFDWKKDGQKEVFLFNSGPQYNNNPLDGQDPQFRGRVFHFQDELKHGNASIIIRDTTCSDSGNYTCIFPRLQPSQTFHIELIVGTTSKPSVTILKRDNEVLLQCEVQGVSPKPKVEWKDSSGNIVPAKEPQVTEKGDIILQATLTKTDNFRCVVTQEKINHQIYAEIYATYGAASKPSVKPVQTKDGMKLQCEVFGVSPKTKVEWKDSSGNIVPAEEPKITDRGGNYDIILEAPVTKTDRYRCVVTQKEIDHQTENDISVTIGRPIGWIVAAVSVICTLAAVGILLGVLYCKGYSIVKQGSTKNPSLEGEKHPMNSDNHKPED